MTLRRQGSWDQAAQQEVKNGTPWLNDPTLQPADYTANPSAASFDLITKATAAAITLTAPVVGTDDFKIKAFLSTTAAAHVITATGLVKGGVTGVNTITFGAFPGAGITLMAFNGLWFVVGQTVAPIT